MRACICCISSCIRCLLVSQQPQLLFVLSDAQRASYTDGAQTVAPTSSPRRPAHVPVNLQNTDPHRVPFCPLVFAESILGGTSSSLRQRHQLRQHQQPPVVDNNSVTPMNSSAMLLSTQAASSRPSPLTGLHNGSDTTRDNSWVFMNASMAGQNVYRDEHSRDSRNCHPQTLSESLHSLASDSILPTSAEGAVNVWREACAVEPADSDPRPPQPYPRNDTVGAEVSYILLFIGVIWAKGCVSDYCVCVG